MSAKFKIGDKVRLNPNMDWNDIYVHSFPSVGSLTGQITGVEKEFIGRHKRYLSCCFVDVIGLSWKVSWTIPESFLMKEVKK